MALTNSLQWRVRAGGNNANGAGFDSTTSGALSTTLNGAITSGATTIVVASATGWPGSGNYYAQIGSVGAEPSGGGSEIVLVTGGQGTTSWTVTRGQLGTTALAAASGVVVSNELTRCNTAAFSGSDGTSNASTTFTSATASFNLTVVGNVLWLASGTNGTAGAYLITGYTNATTITLDRNCSTGAMTNGAFKIGGAWADPQTRTTANILPGNVVYVRAGGSGSVASPDYTSGGYAIPVNGDTTNGNVRFIGENGRPYIKAAASENLIFYNCGYMYFENMYLIANGTAHANLGIVHGGNGPTTTVNVIFDQKGNDCIGVASCAHVVDCEVFSSTANSGAAGSYSGIYVANYTSLISNCNIHDCWGIGVLIDVYGGIDNCIVSNCRGDGIKVNGGLYGGAIIRACTIDANYSNGVLLNDAYAINNTEITGCLFTNHTTASKYGIQTVTGTLATNNRLRGMIDYNWYYNNTANANNLTVGTSSVNGMTLHDSTGTDPGYSSQSTQNYAITGSAKGWSVYTYPNTKSGKTGPTSYPNPGAVMGDPSATSIVINRVNNTFIIDGDSPYAS